MPVFRNEEDDGEDLFGDVTKMADRMGLKGEKRAAYIDDHMMQGGYERVQSRDSYAKVQQQDDDGGEKGNRWGFGSRQRSGNGGGSRPRRDDDNDRY